MSENGHSKEDRINNFFSIFLKRGIKGNKGGVYDFMLFSDSFYFLQENFNVWIGEKHKIIDVPFLFPPRNMADKNEWGKQVGAFQKRGHFLSPERVRVSKKAHNSKSCAQSFEFLERREASTQKIMPTCCIVI
jgi:hypothetical protein